MFGKSLPSRIFPASPSSRTRARAAAGNGTIASQKSVNTIVVSRATRS
jgi:hypothetical protein